jgi:nickel-dependent lactate racemase
MHATSPHRIEVDVPAVTFEAPAYADILTIPAPALPLHDPAGAIANALAIPIGTPPLAQIIANAAPAKPASEKTAVLVVSDITRPDVPYQGESSILHPLLHALVSQGIVAEHITILVATGTHRPSTADEKRRMFGAEVVARYPIVDHDATDRQALRFVATTGKGTEVYINTHYLDADIKILTGEIKPHFMAGFSGGRKAICPGLANLETLQKFHSPQFLENPCAASLILEGNPCHQEAVDVVEQVGTDFIINVTVDEKKRLTGVYAGDWQQAFASATETLADAVRVPVQEPYDVIVTIDATINHYQAAKAAVGALPILATGGQLIQIANSSDGVGSAEYIAELEQLRRFPSHRDYVAALFSRPTVNKDQWEVEMWCKVLEKVGGPSGLIYCTTNIAPDALARLPLTSGYAYTGESHLEPMVQTAIQRTIETQQRRLGNHPRLGIILDGAHVIPCLQPTATYV